MKKVPNMMKAMLVMAVCAAIAVPGIAGAAVEDVVLVNETYKPGRYTLDLSFVGDGKTESVEFNVVNGDGTRQSMVSSVKIILKSGEEEIVVISPDQFSKRKLSSIVQTLGEDVVKDMEDVTLEIKVGGGHGKYKERNGDAREDGFIKRWLKKANKNRVKKDKSIHLTVTEYYENGAVWPPVTSTRPAGW